MEQKVVSNSSSEVATNGMVGSFQPVEDNVPQQLPPQQQPIQENYERKKIYQK